MVQISEDHACPFCGGAYFIASARRPDYKPFIFHVDTDAECEKFESLGGVEFHALCQAVIAGRKNPA